MISEFRGEFAFLSNFYACEVEFEGEVYPTVEHAFQAAKTENPEERARVRSAKTPKGAKMLGRRVTLRPGWDYQRVDVMKELVRKKFHHPKMREKLLATGDEELVEGNTWHDRYWGRCICPKHDGDGLNWLGRILMRIREELRQQQSDQGRSGSDRKGEENGDVH